MLHLTTQNFDICRMNHWQFSSDTPTKAGSEHPTLAVVMFYAVWCGKCAMMRPVIEDLEKKYQKKYFGSICFFEVETSESALLAAQYQTALLPSFLIFKDRELIATMQGMIPQKELDSRLQVVDCADADAIYRKSLEIVNLYFLGKHTVLCYIKKVTGIKIFNKKGAW